MNWQLLSFVFTIASGVTIGVFMTIALVTGMDSISHIITAVLLGLFVSTPITWVVAKKLENVGIAKPKAPRS